MNSIEAFKNSLRDYHPDIRELSVRAADLLKSVRPDAHREWEKSWGGYLLHKQPVDGGNTVCWVSAHTKHVSIGFAEGTELADPAGLLSGTGKRQRHAKIKKLEDLENPNLRALLEQAWARQPDKETLSQSLEQLRELCFALPDVSETVSHGHPTFKAGKKSFAVYGIYAPSLAFKADFTLHENLSNDERFYPTPYMARQGWLSIRLDDKTDWNEIKDLLRHSYAQVAGKKNLARVEETA